MINFRAEIGESNPPTPAYRQAGSSCSAKVDKSSFYVSPDELNANSISDYFSESDNGLLLPTHMSMPDCANASFSPGVDQIRGLF
jgi:hypothetical protein